MSVPLDTAIELAQGAGEVLAGYYGRLRRVDAERKQGVRRDLVSEADMQAQDFIVRRIPPGQDVISEEQSVPDRYRDAPRLWIVDPLDGTVNFLHGIPFWAVSIAFVEKGQLAAAVVHAPELRQTFTAVAGEGARLNGEPIHVSPTTELSDSIVATGFAYRRNELPDHNVDNFATLCMASAGIRRMGAAAIDLAYLACGRLDGFWELHLSPWDLAAGALLIREAGGRVTDFEGREDLDSILWRRHLVASNGHIHEQIRERLAPLRGLE